MFPVPERPQTARRIALGHGPWLVALGAWSLARVIATGLARVLGPETRHNQFTGAPLFGSDFETNCAGLDRLSWARASNS